MTDSGIAALAEAPPGPVLSALLDEFDPAQLTPEQAVPVLRAWSRQRAHDHARMAATVARVAALSRRASGPVVGEWAGSEIAAALTWSESKAGRELEFAETLAGLPQVAVAFEAGRIDYGKAWVFTDVLGTTDLTEGQVEAVCAMYVPLAPNLTAGQLRHRLVRAVLAVDPEWAGRRYRRAVSGRRVCGYIAADGTATVSGSGLPVDQAAAACARVDALAEELRHAGYPGSVLQVRADVFVRLLDGRLTGLSTPEIIATLLADAAEGSPSPVDPTPSTAGASSSAGSSASGPSSSPDRDLPDRAPSDRVASDSAANSTTQATPEGAATPGRAGSGVTSGRADTSSNADKANDADIPNRAATPGEAATAEGVAGAVVGERGVVAEPVRQEPGRGALVGIEICVGLPTLLGLDERPGEIRGWGAVVPEVARAVVARQRHARWRFAVLDDSGHLLLADTTRHRPRLTDIESAGAEGGVVELHVTSSELRHLASDPDVDPRWAPVIADLAHRFADRHRLLAALDAHPDARLVRGALLRHVQIRDRGCVAPGCRRRARVCDVDHTVAHAAGGPTAAGNVGPLCPRHHALKHLGGWGLEQPEPGRFRWTSPLGQSYDTRGEPIRPPLPEALPRPPAPDRPHGGGSRDADGPSFYRGSKGPPQRPDAPRPPSRPRWRSSREQTEDPADPAPF